jgi:plasmid maintenance system antidote protein VapI
LPTPTLFSAGVVVPIPRKARELMAPLDPGELLREDFLIPLGMTAEMLASEIRAPERRIVAIVKEGGDWTAKCACGWRNS